MLVIASTARHSAQNIAFHEVGRQAIMADPKWQGGDYYGGQGPGQRPRRRADGGAYHLSVRSRACTRSSAAGCRTATEKTFGFDADFQVESYLRHQGLSFTDRFDANSYLYITRAMDYFDLAEEARRAAGRCVRRQPRPASAWSASIPTGSIPPRKAAAIAHALNAAGAPVSFVELSAPFGHDSFLLDVPALDRVIAGFLEMSVSAPRSCDDRRKCRAGMRGCSMSAAATAR